MEVHRLLGVLLGTIYQDLSRIVNAFTLLAAHDESFLTLVLKITDRFIGGARLISLQARARVITLIGTIQAVLVGHGHLNNFVLVMLQV